MAIHKTQGSVGWVKPEDWKQKATEEYEESRRLAQIAERVRKADRKQEVLRDVTLSELFEVISKRFEGLQTELNEVKEVLRGVGWL
jgi:methionine aminopeptidase